MKKFRKVLECVIILTVMFCVSEAAWISDWHRGWAWAAQGVIILMGGMSIAELIS